MTTPIPNLLCQSLDPRKPQADVWRREVAPGYDITLRPVSLHNDADVDAIHNWLAAGYPAHLPVDQLRVLFILIAESTYAQAFMVLLNDDTPIGQVEVYQV